VRAALPSLLAGLVTVLFAAASAAFVWQPGLASFADDSASYLVMAQVFSPWEAASPPVAEAFAREAFYPPLYPMLLALAGAANDMALAHVVTALLLAACLPLAYALGTRWLESRWAALAAVAMTALLPSLWIHAKGTLSEPLFTLLLLATLWLIEAKRSARGTAAALAVAMAALVLTRTVGLVLVAAYVFWAFTRRQMPLSARARAALPALAATAAYAAWVLLRPAETSDDYLRIVLERTHAILAAGNPWQAFGFSVMRQANALAEAWTGALLLFWVEGRPVRVLLAGSIGLLALVGMAVRLASGKADGWMIAAYLATFLVWPFYDQMTRFLFPALPALILYAFWTTRSALAALGRQPAVGHALLVVLLLSLTVPGLAFIHQRAQAEGRYVEMTDWYRTPDLAQAQARAQVHLDLMADMDRIRALTRPGDRVMWVAPSYIALLAQRYGIAAPAAELPPDEYRRAVFDSNADYVFFSTYHPRDTIRDAAWRAGVAAMAGLGEVVHERAGGAGNSSVLLRLRAPDRQLLQARGEPQ
jgi:hypothetical protein